MECQICINKFKNIKLLSCHLASHQISSREYYDKYLKKNKEGICKICSNPTSYISLSLGYRIYCGRNCNQKDPEIRNQIQLKKKQSKIQLDLLDTINHIEKMKGVFEHNKLVCQICGFYGKNLNGMMNHIVQKHKISSKCYYDIFFKSEKEGICKICGKPTKYFGFNQYSKYCSHSCATSDDKTQNKMKNTCLKNYGVEYSLQSEEVREKIKQTCLERYGVNNPSQVEEIHNKKIESIRKKYGVDYSFQADKVKEIIKETIISKYGVNNPSQCQKLQNKKIETSLNRYGVSHPAKTEEFQIKRKQTCLKNLGVDNPLKSKKVIEKIKSTNLLKYGVEWGLASEDIQEKGIRTNREKYGYDYWTQSPKGRKILRINHLKRIHNQYKNNEPLSPNIGNKERECLDELQKYTKFEIKRNSKMIGYFPDGYIEELNLVIEFDERYHFIDEWKTYREKDINKNKDYKKEKLNCFRIKESDWMVNKKYIIVSFLETIQSLS